MKKQRIEDIFSSMEDFSSVPPPELWDKIEEKLHKPKKKKVIAIWWSIAATLFIGLSIPAILHFSSNTPSIDTKNPIVLQNRNNTSDIKNEPNATVNNRTITNDTVNKTQKESILVLSNPENASSESSKSNINSKNSVSTNTKYESHFKSRSAAGQNLAPHSQSKTNAIAHNTASQKTKQSNPLHFKNTIAKNNPEPKQSAGTTFVNPINNNPNALFVKEANLAQTSKEESENPKIAILPDSKSDILLTSKDSIELADLQKLEKAIAEAQPNTKEEEKKNAQTKEEKWSVGIFGGIANSQNLNNQKTLGYTNESKKTNSYGVKTNYKLNKKWAVSSGLKINELGQSMANVTYSSPLTSNITIVGGDFKPSNSVSTVATSENYVFLSESSKSSLKENNFETGKVDQSLKYIEMPLEVSYALFARNKTSISLNTGAFFGKLISNQVSLDGTVIGNNLEANDFVYGSVLSSTLQYSLYKKTKVFVEPGMNYYINPLNNQTFNQFQWMFNFGLNISF